jgi:hypothetical protein
MMQAMAARLLCIAACVAAGCASPSVRPCSSNAQCALGSYCDKTNCRTDCRGDFDCIAPLVCDKNLGRCVGGGLPDGGAPDLRGRDLAGNGEDLAQPLDDMAE